MNVIKKIMCLLAIIGSLVTLNNLAMAMQLAARDFMSRILTLTKVEPLDQNDLAYIDSILVNYPGLANTRIDDTTGTTLLMLAIKAGFNEVVQLFLQDPATDVNIRNAKGNRALHYLVSYEGLTPLGHMVIIKNIPLIKIILARGASPFDRDNNYNASALSIVSRDYPDIYEYLSNYVNYEKILYNSARMGDLRGVQYALVKGNVSVNMKNNDLPLRFAIPVNEIGNTPFHAAILGALDRYERLLPEINRINESRNEGINKIKPAFIFDNKISELKAPIDNMLRLIKIHNPDTAVRNVHGETVGDLMSKAITEHVKTWRMLFDILLESHEQSMDALRKAKIIG